MDSNKNQTICNHKSDNKLISKDTEDNLIKLEDGIITNLIKLGLKKNEAKVYHALVANGQTTASHIAKLAHVPRSKVYDAIYGLEVKGLVRRMIGLSPAEFQAYAPRETIPFLIERVESVGNSVMNALIALEQHKTKEEEPVRTVVGKQQIIMELRTTIGRAKKTVKISAREISIVRSLKSVFVQAKHRGIKIELYITFPLEERLDDLQYYLTIKNLSPSSELLKSVQDILVEPTITEGVSSPEETSIFIIDGTESVAVFNYSSMEAKPWALCIRNTLISTIQWVVIKTLLSALGYEIEEAKAKRPRRRFGRFYRR